MFCKDFEEVLGVAAMDGVVCQGLVEGVPVEVLLNKRSARTQVRKELVPEDKVLVEGMVGVQCDHGEVVYYPIAVLNVVVGDRRWS